MLYPKHLFFLLATFLVPATQAIVSNQHSVDMDGFGYYCSNHSEVRMINIVYGSSPQGLPCQVTFQQNSGSVTQLLSVQRNVDICEYKADSMAARMIDRGWSCQASGN